MSVFLYQLRNGHVGQKRYIIALFHSFNKDLFGTETVAPMNQCNTAASCAQKKSIVKSGVSAADYGYSLFSEKAAVAQRAIADAVTDKFCFSG